MHEHDLNAMYAIEGGYPLVPSACVTGSFDLQR
jgi:hypothetical protein